ncbi:MAG TPA: permease [Xanthobacteraceae bacterium]|jgi:uncharacterized membrane protein YraQ (UPF0718 family)|nr:permease [Xanthobacteraceae bacterium]
MSTRKRAHPFDWSTIVIAVLVSAAAVTVFIRDGQSRALAILGTDFGLLLDILPKVLAGCFIGAFVTVLLPREAVTRWVGAESGLSGILIATIMGALLPGGPFTIYPVAAAFLSIGADVGAAIAFVISWTLLGYNRALIWELPFFGLDFVTWRIILSIPLPIIAAVTARMVLKIIAAWRDHSK